LELVKTLAFFNLQLDSSLLAEEAEILAKRYGVKFVVTDDGKKKFNLDIKSIEYTCEEVEFDVPQPLCISKGKVEVISFN